MQSSKFELKLILTKSKYLITLDIIQFISIEFIDLNFKIKKSGGKTIILIKKCTTILQISVEIDIDPIKIFNYIRFNSIRISSIN